MNIWPFRISPEIRTVINALNRVDEWEYLPHKYPDLEHTQSGLRFTNYSYGWTHGYETKVGIVPTYYEWWVIRRAMHKLLNRMTSKAMEESK